MIEKETHKFSGPSNGNKSFLFGHKEQIAFLLNCIRNNQIPNAWLFHGPVGIGKASLALNVAKVLSDNGIFKKDNLSYLSEKYLRNPNAAIRLNNIFFCKRKWDDKKKLFQKNISIDNIRELGRKFYLSSADYTYKVCIVDTTEDLNISASNSLINYSAIHESVTYNNFIVFNGWFNNFLDIANKHSDRIKIVDGNRSPQQVSAQIIESIDTLAK